MNESPQPREENMELAAKLVILADERSAAAVVGAITSEGDLEGQQSSQEPNAGPPTQIGIPEQESILDDLDSISASIPFILARLIQENESTSAEALNHRFQQITKELVDAVRTQLAESLSTEYTMDPRPTLTTAESSQDGTLLPTEGDTATRTFGVDPPDSPTVDVDPPDSHAVDPHSFDSRPDPPALQVLIDDLLKKVDPDGSILSDDVKDWVLERFHPAGQATIPQPNSFCVDSPDLDNKMPGQPINEYLNLVEWEIERKNAMQSVREFPSQLCQVTDLPQPGAFQVINSAARAGSPPPTVDTSAAHAGSPTPTVDTSAARAGLPTPTFENCEMQEQKSVSSLPVPLMEAHPAYEDQARRLEKLNDSVVSLQQSQMMLFDVQTRLVESLSSQYHYTAYTEPTVSTTQSSQDGTFFPTGGDTASVSDSVDPPALHAADAHSSDSRPDPPVPQDSPDLDRKMPGQPIDEDVNLDDWEMEGENAVQSVRKFPWQERRVTDLPQPGVFRVINSAARAGSPTPTVDTSVARAGSPTPTVDTCEMQEQKSISSLPVPPMEAHPAYEDQARRLEKLNDSVVSLTRLVESLSNQYDYTADNEPTVSTTQRSQDGTFFPTGGDTASVSDSVDPPALHAADAHSSNSRPDPPAPQIPWTNLFHVDSPDLDNRTPGQPIDEDVKLVDWEMERETAVQSVRESPSQECRVTDLRQPGAFRVINSAARAGSPTPTVDTSAARAGLHTPAFDTCVMKVQTSVSSLPVPLMEAHPSYKDQARRFEKPNKAVVPLQQSQMMVDDVRTPLVETIYEDDSEELYERDSDSDSDDSIAPNTKPTSLITQCSEDGTLLPTEDDTSIVTDAAAAHSSDSRPDPPSPQIPPTCIFGVDSSDPDSKMPGQPIDEDANLVDWEKEQENAVQSVREFPLQERRRTHSFPPTQPGAERVPGVSLSPTHSVETNEDQAWRLEELDEAILSLQLQQHQIPEATIVHASEVITEDNDSDAKSFFEMYGTTILTTCLVFGVGILAGSRTRHGGGHS